MARTFVEFSIAKHGPSWVVAPRLTHRLRDKGYTVALSQKRFSALEREWETETYGAPLKSLHAASPAMFAALALLDGLSKREIERPLTQRTGFAEFDQAWRDALALAKR